MVFEAGVVHVGDTPLMSRPDHNCRTCHHRFESRPPGTEDHAPNGQGTAEGSAHTAQIRSNTA